ncbi:MAG: DUF4349 domain-containing protein [Chloracidobacterium sp.]|nr:DUF4349 domain-containing protein [Chloracidobacterium sp.]
MKKLSLAVLIFSLVTVSFTGCGAGLAEPSTAERRPGATAFETADSNPGGGGGGGKTDPSTQSDISLTGSETARQPAVPTDRKIIRNADIGLESATPEEAQKKISSIAESSGGFVVETQQSSSDRRSSIRDTVTMTVRVPADKFDQALEEIRKTADRVVVETVKGQDVTEEFIDIEARLKAKRALEEQFMEIMKRANSVDDALNVQRQLAEVRGEIEKIEGRKRFLENQTSLSTIKVRIQTPAAISASGAGFFSQLAEAINTGIEAATGFVLGLVTFAIAILPFIIFICLPIFLILRYLWKRLRRRRTAAQIVEEELSAEE